MGNTRGMSYVGTWWYSHNTIDGMQIESVWADEDDMLILVVRLKKERGVKHDTYGIIYGFMPRNGNYYGMDSVTFDYYENAKNYVACTMNGVDLIVDNHRLVNTDWLYKSEYVENRHTCRYGDSARRIDNHWYGRYRDDFVSMGIITYDLAKRKHNAEVGWLEHGLDTAQRKTVYPKNRM